MHQSGRVGNIYYDLLSDADFAAFALSVCLLRTLYGHSQNVHALEFQLKSFYLRACPIAARNCLRAHTSLEPLQIFVGLLSTMLCAPYAESVIGEGPTL